MLIHFMQYTIRALVRQSCLLSVAAAVISWRQDYPLLFFCGAALVIAIGMLAVRIIIIN